ncbi:haloacid dehalogenase type II [Nocardioides sp. TF02-7]|uniref:haloacid dehalogenase type II n=1 Tax=Nocardioides sp. TF02-7 TaxID=2917724 RepID=UPI001F05307E|nr:haloacid dehalogenase type II [Nocardioides sp. TF02-7]UMG92424.1 haloacid dehalogenase type II [Nocardioides sp. TF02-7]
MLEATSIDVVVFDVLGTMVDEPAGLRAAFRDARPGADDAVVDQMLGVWQAHVREEQRRIAAGDRPFASTVVIDREAAGHAAAQIGLVDPAALDRLSTAAERMEPWEDSVAGLERIGRAFPVVGLSNASRATLLRLDAHAGLRWHLVLSAEDAGAYKPAPEVYQLAVDAAGCPPDRILMVAAHAWDLRGAQALGMRTAYVQRPVGDPPVDSDAFDGHFENLLALAEALDA